MKVRTAVVAALGMIGLTGAASQAAVTYNLTNANWTTVTYKATESLTNSDSSNLIVRSLGLASNSTFGLLSDATLTPGGGFISPDTNPHGITNANNIITQTGTNNSTLDLDFVAPAGFKFGGGTFRVSYAIFDNHPLWDPSTDYLAWQVSADGGPFVDILRQYTAGSGPSGTHDYDTGFLSLVPTVYGATTLTFRGKIDSSGGASTTNTQDHWRLIETAPFGSGSGLEINLLVPEPASIGMLALAAGSILTRRRRR